MAMVGSTPTRFRHSFSGRYEYVEQFFRIANKRRPFAVTTGPFKDAIQGAGIDKMQRGLEEYEATGTKLRSPYFLGLLADQLGKAGRLEEAFEVITRGLTLAEQTGEG